MMSNIKNIIIVVVIIVAVLLGYLFFFNKTPDVANLDSGTGDTSGTIETTSDVTGGIAGDFITTLLNVKNITLDASLLSDPAFATLRDSSIELIPDGTEGRPNPFAPIGVDIGALPTGNTAVTSTPTQTTPVKPTN